MGSLSLKGVFVKNKATQAKTAITLTDAMTSVAEIESGCDLIPEVAVGSGVDEVASVGADTGVGEGDAPPTILKYTVTDGLFAGTL